MKTWELRCASGAAAVALSLALLAPSAAWAAQSVPPGTQVMLQFAQTVSTKTARVGDLVRMRVYTDVLVNGRRVIRQDAPAQGVVTTVHRPRTFGRKGELKIRLQHVRDVRGTRVPLEPYKSGNRFAAGGPAAAGGGLLVFGPVGLVAGVFVKGKEITITKGTRIEAQVAGTPPEADRQ